MLLLLLHALQAAETAQILRRAKRATQDDKDI